MTLRESEIIWSWIMANSGRKISQFKYNLNKRSGRFCDQNPIKVFRKKTRL